MRKLYVGTSGWMYEHWKGVFYPEDVKSRQYLEYYAQNFDCIELNASFYRLPSHKTVLGWKHRTPDDFFWCPKLQ